MEFVTKSYRDARSKLTEEDVRTIRRHCDAGTMTTRQLSRTYLITEESIRKIARRTTWMWVSEAETEEETVQAETAEVKKGVAFVKRQEMKNAILDIDPEVVAKADRLLGIKTKPPKKIQEDSLKSMGFDSSIRQEDMRPPNALDDMPDERK